MGSLNGLNLNLNGVRFGKHQADFRHAFRDESLIPEHNMVKLARRPQTSVVIQTSLYVFVAMVIMVCALIHLFIYRRRRKAKKKKHMYENTKPSKSSRSFLVEPKLFEKKSKTTTASKGNNSDIEYKQPGKALCYSIVDITDDVSTREHFTHGLGQSKAVSLRQHFSHLRKSEPDLRKSCDYYESIEIPSHQDNKKRFASNAKNKATEATAKLKKFGADKKSKLQRTFQSLTNLCLSNLDSCEDLTKGKDSAKCDYNRLMSPSSPCGRSVGNIYDTLSRQNPWKLAARGPDRYEDVEVQIVRDEKPLKKDNKKRYQSISVPKYCPEKGEYNKGRFPLTGLVGAKTSKWPRCNRFWTRQSKSSEYDHVQMNLPMCAKSSHKPSVTPKPLSPLYFTLDPSMKQKSNRTPFNI